MKSLKRYHLLSLLLAASLVFPLTSDAGPNKRLKAKLAAVKQETRSLERELYELQADFDALSAVIAEPPKFTVRYSLYQRIEPASGKVDVVAWCKAGEIAYSGWIGYGSFPLGLKTKTWRVGTRRHPDARNQPEPQMHHYAPIGYGIEINLAPGEPPVFLRAAAFCRNDRGYFLAPDDPYVEPPDV